MISAHFQYGPGRGAAMDEALSAAAAPPESSKPEDLARWGWACSQAACWRAWDAAMSAPPRAAGPDVRAVAEAALAGIPERLRMPVMAESLDKSVVSGNVPALEWLLSKGAPRSPGPWALGSRHGLMFDPDDRDGAAKRSWCALAAMGRRFEVIEALEAFGIGEADRSEDAGPFGRSAPASWFSCHPWVAACSFDGPPGEGRSAAAARVAKRWRPASPEVAALCERALRDNACALWSAKAAKTLAKIGRALDGPQSEELSDSVRSALAEIGRAPPAGSRREEDFVRAAMAWCAACGGPSQADLAKAMLSDLDGAAGSSNWEEAARWAKALGALAKVVAERGFDALGDGRAWARVASVALGAALASAPAEAVSLLRAGFEPSMARLDSLAGSGFGVKSVGPKRM